MLKLAIVILNWNGKKFLEQFLPSVISNSNIPGVEIYVADNGSTDSSIDSIKANFPTVKLILLDKNYGFSQGYNLALAQINAEYFVLLNSDVEVTPGWLTEPMTLLNSDAKIAAVTPKILAFHNKQYFEYAGSAGGFIDKFGFPFCRGRILNVIEKDEGQYNRSTEVFWASGACLFVKAELFKIAGGLDAFFFAHMEEIDLCWRLKNMGYKIMYCPGSTIFHVGGGTLPNNSPRKLFLNFRNNLLLLYKNLPSENLRSKMFQRMMIDGVAACKFLVSFHFKEFWSVFCAHRAFYSARKNYKLIRKELMQKVDNPNLNGLYKKSILVDFYFRKRRKFTELGNEMKYFF